MSAAEIYSPGLEGVDRRRDGHLHDRGRPALPRLPGRRTGRERRLRRGRLPAAARRTAEPPPAGRLPAARSAPPGGCRTRCSTCCSVLPPAARPMDVLRTAVSVLAHFDPDTGDSSHDANLRKAERLLGADPGGRGRPLPPQPGAGSRPRPAPTWRTRPTSCTCCAASEAPAGRRPRPGRVADPVRRARVQRLDVHGPRRLLDASPTCTRPSWPPSARSKARCTAAPTRR